MYFLASFDFILVSASCSSGVCKWEELFCIREQLVKAVIAQVHFHYRAAVCQHLIGCNKILAKEYSTDIMTYMNLQKQTVPIIKTQSPMALRINRKRPLFFSCPRLERHAVEPASTNICSNTAWWNFIIPEACTSTLQLSAMLSWFLKLLGWPVKIHEALHKTSGSNLKICLGIWWWTNINTWGDP